MPTFDIAGDCLEVLGRLFRIGENGHIEFGWSVRSEKPSLIADLLSAPIRFRDYIMEGFVMYVIYAEDLHPGCRLTFRGEGSNRDWSILPQARHFIQAAKVSIASETVD